MSRLATALLTLAIAGAGIIQAAAQPLTQRFAADPSPHWFQTGDGGRFYLYATDDASNSGKYWDSTTWRLYTSPDMKTWADAGVPLAVTVFK